MIFLFKNFIIYYYIYNKVKLHNERFKDINKNKYDEENQILFLNQI